MDRRVLITCLVFALVFCLVLSLLGILGAGFLIRDSESTQGETTVQEPASQEPLPSPLGGDDDSSPSNPAASAPLPPATLAEMGLIQRQVVQERGLDPSGEFTRVLFSPAQLHQHILDDFLLDYTAEEMHEDGIVLEAFGLLNADFDLYNFYLDLLSENIAGFYDNETKEMVVVQGSKFGGIERLTYAHEYTHALQDQNFDIQDGLQYSQEACENESERCAALQALLEGDASLSEFNWFMNNATTEDRTDIFAFSDTFESPVMDSSPAFISRDFLFPYEEGLAFVQYLYDRGGWEAVDQAYANPPVSTEQILHPQKYPHDSPVPVLLPDLSMQIGQGWVDIEQDVMGEWYTYLILAHGLQEDARVKDEVAADAAEGWQGDAYTVLYNPEQDATVMVLRTFWESPQEAKEFRDSFLPYAGNRFGKPQENQQDFTGWRADDGVHRLYLRDDYTTWIYAPDQALVVSIWTAIGNP